MLVIFDNDGVLVDSERISNGVLAEMLTEIGLECTLEDCVRDYMGRSWDGTKAIIEERLGGPIPDGWVERRRERMLRTAQRELKAIPGVADALDRLDGTARCVASSSSHRWIEFVLGHTQLIHHFPGHARFSANDVGRGKPHPDLFLHAASAMGFAAGDCVVVEDSPVGVQAAKAAGMRVVGYAGHTDPGLLRRADADDVIADMADLVTALGCAPR